MATFFEPQTAIFNPSAVEQALSTASVRDPMVAPHLFAERMRRQASQQQYLDAIQQTNEQVGAEAANKGNIDMLNGMVSGAKGFSEAYGSGNTSEMLNSVAQRLGMQGLTPKSPYYQQTDDARIAGQQAGAMKDLAAAQQSSAESGQTTIADPALLDAMGTQQTPQTPTSVQAAGVTAMQPKATVKLLDGTVVTMPATTDQLTQANSMMTPGPTATTNQMTEIKGADPNFPKRRATANRYIKLLNEGGTDAQGKIIPPNSFVKEEPMQDGSICITYRKADGTAGKFYVTDQNAR